jgi:hypothetical protein
MRFYSKLTNRLSFSFPQILQISADAVLDFSFGKICEICGRDYAEKPNI